MSDSNRRPAMEQIIGNMNNSIHKNEGQYVQLGLTPQTNPSEQVSWASTNQSYLHCNSDLPPLYNLNQHQQVPQYTQPNVQFNYVQSPYEKCIYQSSNMHNTNLYHPFYISPHDHQENNYIPTHGYHDNVVLNNTSNNATHILENVVGNWVPNTTGTYSPFGNTSTPKTGIANIFDTKPELQHAFNHTDDTKSDEFTRFNFTNRDGKKRIVVEVKPMRPTYSDILTKSPPTTLKASKTDIKDPKNKKDNKKVVRNEKGTKTNLHRINSDIKIEKVIKTNEKPIKNDQLNRRWSSLDNMHTSIDVTAKKTDEIICASKTKTSGIKPGKKTIEPEYDDEIEELDNRNESALNISKTIRKGNAKNATKPRSENDKSINAKRTQRNRKREKQFTFGLMREKLKQYVPGWWKLFVSFCLWLVNLVSDICSLSVHLSKDIVFNFWSILTVRWGVLVVTMTNILGHVTFLTWICRKIRKKKDKAESTHIPSQYTELDNNIAMPSTGEEAMKRLLACKGKDPYSILGVMPTCSDDDIKRYYKRQAFLVHPDKNQQPGAEEAFKILVHAFDMIGEPERRARYDRGVAESAQVEQAWSKLTELLAQLQKKVEAAANTIRCSACGLRHKRIKVGRPSYAARDCASCKIHHSAREGDIWAEARCLGFLWHYYACMDGGIYDITEWAGCQKESLKHLKPNSHNVQYRIALGKQNGQQPRNTTSPRNERQPNLESLLSSLYGNKDVPQNTTKRRNKKTK